jgi:hypothetical protein
LDSKEYTSAYAIAKICGYTGSFDDFKNLYTQYYSEIVNSLPEEKQVRQNVKQLSIQCAI